MFIRVDDVNKMVLIYEDETMQKLLHKMNKEKYKKLVMTNKLDDYFNEIETSGKML